MAAVGSEDGEWVTL